MSIILGEQLLDACQCGDFDKIKYCLTSPEITDHADIHYKNERGTNALMWACLNGHLEIVKFLLTSPELKEHADIHHQRKDGWNALLYACLGNQLEVMKYLLTSSELTEHADIHHQSNNGNVLMNACGSGHLDIIEYLLLERNMSVDNNTMNWLKTENHTDVIKMIKTRDLHQKLQNNIVAKKQIKRKKI